MGIWERLGNVVRSYLSGESEGSVHDENFHDSDLHAAYEELDDFLRGKEAPKGTSGGAVKSRQVPEELWADFAELGVSQEANAEECKEAYKKLLKLYHPDRHAENTGAINEATRRTAAINAAYERLEKWFRTLK